MLKARKKVDLTHTISAASPTWTDEEGVQIKMTTDIIKEDDWHYRSYHLNMTQNVGTHLDSPAHFSHKGITVCELDIANLVDIPFHIINVADKVEKNSDYELTVDDIMHYEAKHNTKILEQSLVLCYTGWDRYWNDKQKYRGINEKDGIMHFPVWSLEAVKFLDQSRNVAGIAIDNLSPENNSNPMFPIHSYILGRGKYIVENVANATSMPAYGGIVSVLPMKVDKISESPVRMIGTF